MKRPGDTVAGRGCGWGRWLGFRLAAVLLGLAPFALAEAALVALDWGRPTFREDPFVGFSEVHPLFVLSPDGQRYEVAPSRLAFFRPESFAAAKGPTEVRIFCLGGSTVQGRPFAIETSFTTWLELNLRLADPRRAWDVVNCGGISYASYRLVPILEEVLRYQPDLVIVYAGHNEFLEDREYGPIRDLPAVVSRPWAWVTQTRTYHVLRDGYLRLTGRADPEIPARRPVLGPEVDAILDYQGGLARYHWDAAWRHDVTAHFRSNLYRMVRMAREAGVPLLLMNPVSNLRDCPPMKSEHRSGLTAEELAAWESLCREAAEDLGPRPQRAVERFRQAVAIDDQAAEGHYLLGRAYEAVGLTAEARREYVAAKDLDVCPLRMLEPMHDAVQEIARQTAAPLVDVRPLFEQRSRGGIPDGTLLLDHVHPSIAGHRLIADALTDELIRQGIVRPVAGWRERQEAAAQRHLESLGDFYFAKGRQRLEALRAWTRGDVTRVRPGSAEAGGGEAATREMPAPPAPDRR